MMTRTIKTVVEFRRPFSLPLIDALQPAGKYQVETDEVLIEGTSLIAYRRVTTRLYLARDPLTPGVTEEAIIDPADLAAALARDTAEITALGEKP